MCTHYHSVAFQHPPMPTSGSPLCSVVSSQHIQVVTSHKGSQSD